MVSVDAPERRFSTGFSTVPERGNELWGRTVGMGLCVGVCLWVWVWGWVQRGGGGGTEALEGKGPQRRSQKRFDRRLKEVAKAVGGRSLSVTNAIETGTWREGDSGWA